MSGKIKSRNTPFGFCWMPTHLCPLCLLPATHAILSLPSPQPQDHRGAEAVLSRRHTDMVCHPQGLDTHSVHPGPLSGKPSAVLRADTLCERRHSNNRNDKTRALCLERSAPTYPPSHSRVLPPAGWVCPWGRQEGSCHLDRDHWCIPDPTGCPRFHWSKGPLPPHDSGQPGLHLLASPPHTFHSVGPFLSSSSPQMGAAL